MLYNAIPLFRYFRLQQENEKISERNERRKEWYVYLKSLESEQQSIIRGDSKKKRLYSKLASARKLLSELKTKGSLGRLYTAEDVIYSTKPDEEAGAKYEKDELSRFDKRLQN